MDRRQLASAIFTSSHLTGQFTLRSGATSGEYFDKYRFEADPPLLRAIAQAMASMVPDGTDVLAGLELGGVPLAVMLVRSPASRPPSCASRPSPTAPGASPRAPRWTGRACS
jgi:orotate phosphoribosyltransferase